MRLSGLVVIEKRIGEVQPICSCGSSQIDTCQTATVQEQLARDGRCIRESPNYRTGADCSRNSSLGSYPSSSGPARLRNNSIVGNHGFPASQLQLLQLGLKFRPLFGLSLGRVRSVWLCIEFKKFCLNFLGDSAEILLRESVE